MFIKILASIRKCLTLVSIELVKILWNSNKLVIGKIKDETAGVAIEGFVELKPKVYLYLEDDNSEHKKAKLVNKNVILISDW